MSNPVFYIANLIDYCRIALLIASVFTSGGMFVCLYAISVSLDYFDGMAARYLNQVSILGSILDMLIDRVSTMIILVKTAVEKPKYARRAMLYSIIDILSHFVFFTLALISGVSHKSFSSNIFLSVYYNQYFLYFVCFGSELSFIMSYLAKSKSNRLLQGLQGIAGLKTFFHVVHFFVGVSALAKLSSKSN